MAWTFEALWDGTVLIPDEPLDLPPGTRVRIRIEKLKTNLPAEEASGPFPNQQGSPEMTTSPEDWLDGDRGGSHDE